MPAVQPAVPAARPPATGPTYADAAVAPSASIDISRVVAAAGVIVRLAGRMDPDDAVMLGDRLHAEVDAGPTVLIVNLSGVVSCDPGVGEVLIIARDRARAAGIAVHVVDPGGVVADPGAHDPLVRVRP